MHKSYVTLLPLITNAYLLKVKLGRSTLCKRVRNSAETFKDWDLRGFYIDKNLVFKFRKQSLIIKRLTSIVV